MFEHASVAEIVQTAGAMAGAAMSAWGLWRSMSRTLWLRRYRLNGQRMFWALSRVRQEFLRLVAQGVLFVSGVASVMLPPPDEISAVALQGKIRIWALLSISLILATKTAFDIVDRERLESYEWDGLERRFVVPERDNE
jgi:hypothetical protein